MKKIILLIVLMFVITGCGKSDANISNPDGEIWISNDAKFTNKQLYATLKNLDYTGFIVKNAINYVSEKEEINVDEIKTNAETTVQQLIDQGMEAYIYYYGYNSMDDYKESMILDSIITELKTKYANGSYEDLKNEYKPYKAEIIYFDDIDKAQNVVNSVKDGSHTFVFAAEENGYTEQVNQQIYSDSSDLPVEVKELILNSDFVGVSDVVNSSTYTNDADGNQTITPRYYVVNVISRNADDFKEDFIQYLNSDVLQTKDIVNFYLKKYKFKVYDQRTYELLNTNYGDFR